MKVKNPTITLGRSLFTAAIVLGSAVFVLAADTPATSAKRTDNSQKTARLFRDIKADAAQVQAAAAHLDGMARSSGATWLEYDRQWNEIKPAVERMEMNLARLETMRATISPMERKDLDDSKLLIEEIQNRTHQLRALLDHQGVQATDAKFKVYARNLRSESSKLEKAVPIS